MTTTHKNRRGEITYVKIDLNPRAPLRTFIHEGMHGSGSYTEDQVHEMNDAGTIEGCAEDYWPT